jgi:hypothetical protein
MGKRSAVVELFLGDMGSMLAAPPARRVQILTLFFVESRCLGDGDHGDGRELPQQHCHLSGLRPSARSRIRIADWQWPPPK